MWLSIRYHMAHSSYVDDKTRYKLYAAMSKSYVQVKLRRHNRSKSASIVATMFVIR